jgi:hypothetical protein
MSFELSPLIVTTSPGEYSARSVEIVADAVVLSASAATNATTTDQQILCLRCLESDMNPVPLPLIGQSPPENGIIVRSAPNTSKDSPHPHSVGAGVVRAGRSLGV